jgi:hypothetical protein
MPEPTRHTISGFQPTFGMAGRSDHHPCGFGGRRAPGAEAAFKELIEKDFYDVRSIKFPTLFSLPSRSGTSQFPGLFPGSHLCYPVSHNIIRIQPARMDLTNYSTVTDLARLRGLSTSQPRATAM